MDEDENDDESSIEAILEGKTCLTKEDLVARIKTKAPLFEESDLSKLVLLAHANALGVVSENELKASTPRIFKTKKMYLRTMVEDKEVLDKIDEYVEAYSLLWSRCLLSLNLFVHDITKIPFSRQEGINKKQLQYQVAMEHRYFSLEANQLHSLLFASSKRPMFLQQMFLPEKWMEQDALMNEVDSHYKRRSALLAHLYPFWWKTIMSKSGWSEVASNAAMMLRTNIQVHIRRAVVNGAKEYVKHRGNNEAQSKQLLSLLRRPWQKTFKIPLDGRDINAVHTMRTTLGMKDKDYLPTFAPKFDPDLLNLFLYFRSQGLVKSDLMPRGTLGRKYAFLDNLILRFMFPSKVKAIKSRKQLEGMNVKEKDIPMLEHLGFSFESLKDNHRAKRKKIIQEAKKKGRKKLVTKWRRRGCPSTPKEAKISSIKTDGVGLCLTYSYPMKIPTLRQLEEQRRSRQQTTKDEQVLIRLREQSAATKFDPVFVGIDAGRAKLYYGAVLGDPYDDPFDVVFTRRMYYSQIKFKRRKKQWENRVNGTPSLKLAFEALSQNPSLIDYMQVQRTYIDVFYEELIQDKRLALQNMLAWRLKCSSQAKAPDYLVNKITKPNQNTLIGLGHCTVAPTGRGELSVPAKSIYKTIDATIRRHNKANRMKNNTSGFISSISINEHKTTLLCCDCASVTFPPNVTKNNQRCRSSRLRQCPNCNLCKDRDYQASRNILRLTIARYRGEERPPCFCRQQA